MSKDKEYAVHLDDLASTILCKKGYCNNLDERIIRVLLYLYGMDVDKGYSQEFINTQYRSPITGNLCTSGTLFVGVERKDWRWVNEGISGTARLLFSEGGCEELLKGLKLEVK